MIEVKNSNGARGLVESWKAIKVEKQHANVNAVESWRAVKIEGSEDGF